MPEQDATATAQPEPTQASLPLAEGGAASTDAQGTEPTGTTATETPSQSAGPAQAQPNYMGGRFKSVEQMEAYIQGMERQNAHGRQTPSQTEPTPQNYTPTQLRTSRSHWLNEYTKAQVSGDASAAQQSLQNYNWCDEKLTETQINQASRQWRGESAIQSLMQEGNELVKPYLSELQPGNPLYETATMYAAQMKSAMEAGVPLDNIIQGLAIVAAAQKTGKVTAGVKQQATKDFAQAMQQAAKQTVLTGGGQAAKSTAGKVNYAEMNDEDFAKTFAANSGGKSLY